MIIADHLSKYAHFCALPHSFTLDLVAHIFIDYIFKLHGIPTSKVSNCSPTFTSHFWKELFKIQGTKLNMSTSYHPQNYGYTNTINKCMDTYLHCFTLEKQHEWVNWLPLEEWWYNTTYHRMTKMMPYEEVYVQ